eukprot:SM000143S00741  [mRNA]  locus=s143:272182:274816:+ [translate_table: standard]
MSWLVVSGLLGLVLLLCVDIFLRLPSLSQKELIEQPECSLAICTQVLQRKCPPCSAGQYPGGRQGGAVFASRNLTDYVAMLRNTTPTWAQAASERPDYSSPFRVASNGEVVPSSKAEAPLVGLLAPGTLVWTAAAEDRVVAAITANQFPPDCEQRTWLAPDTAVDGLATTFHKWQSALAIGVALNWSVVLVPQTDSVYLQGCPFFQHLGCHLAGLAGCRLLDYRARFTALQQATYTKFDKVDGWYASGTERTGTSADAPPAGIVKVLADKGTVNMTVVKNWQAAMFAAMVIAKEVALVGGGDPLTASEAQREFLFSSVMTKWMLVPGPEALRNVNIALARYRRMTGGGGASPSFTFDPPVIAMPVREGNKTLDNYYRKTGHFRDPKEYVQAMLDLEGQLEKAWSTILLMSDTNSIVKQFTDNPQSLGIPINHAVVVDQGLRVDLQDPQAKRPPRWHLRNERRFMAALYMVCKLADYSVVTYSSNVGRLIGECLGARKRVAQVDALGPVVKSLDDPWHSPF